MSRLDRSLELGGISVQNRRAPRFALLRAGLICDQTQRPADLNLNLYGIAIAAKRANQDAAPKPSVKTIKWLSCATAAFPPMPAGGGQPISRSGTESIPLCLGGRAL